MATETLYTLKKGVDVKPEFDGVVIPIQVPASVAEIIGTSGGSKEDVELVKSIESRLSEGARKVAVAIFNQAHKLNVQKSVKAETFEDGATVASLRDHAATFKYGQVRVRTGTGNGAARVKPATVNTVLGDDFLAMLTPEQRKVYDEKMAKLSAKPAEAKPAEGATAPAAKPAAKK